VELHVLPERPLEQRVVGARTSGVEREHRLLLAAEVLDGVREERRDVGGRDLEPPGRVRVGPPEESARLHELVVVVLGQRHEGGMTLHGSSRWSR
jgi:hypothetical protein